MTRLILVRHGQTEWNRVERFRGRIDLDLNEVGRAQALALAERLSAEPLSAIYTSPLRRAVQTAEPAAQKLGLSVQVLGGLMDIDYGQWGGRSPAEVATLYPKLYRLWRSQPHLVEIPGGESLAVVRARAFPALKEVAARHAGQTILLVAHQVVNKVLLCAMLGLDNSRFWHIQQDNACLNIFDYEDDDFTAVCLNDTCHLKALILPEG